MVKKLQALKAKKGFTLVELIVVIAIIGVLAAILVPTMMGMVTKSRVTSADQTAKGLADTVNTWMSDLEANKGTIPTGTVAILIKGHADYDAASEVNSWNGYVNAAGFAAAGETGAASESGASGYTDAGGAKALKKLKDTLANDYNFNTDITALVWVSGRKVIGAAYVDTATDVNLSTVFSAAAFRSAAYEWDGKTDGIVGGETALAGKIVGTSPKLLMDNVAASA